VEILPAYPVFRPTAWQFSDDPVEALGDRGREVAEQQTEDVMMHTTLTRRFNLQHPIFQAPLAGGGDTPELVAAVSKAGALGFIGAAYLTPEEIVATASAIRKKTSGPFGMNLFAPLSREEFQQDLRLNLERLAPYFAELGLPHPSLPPSAASSFEDQLAAVLETKVCAFSFTFGLLPAKAVQTLKSCNTVLIGTATTVDEAIALENSGVDAIVTQGSEAGGHRGSFAAEFSSGMVGSISLIPQVVDAVRIPVIASGGIMDGRGVVAALALGASAVQMGTAFLTCHEAGIPEAYKTAILAAHEDHTRVTRAFSGRPARGIVNRFMSEMEARQDMILPFPLQNALTRPLRAAAAKQGRAEFLSLWAGQGVRLARRQSAQELITRLAIEMEETLAALGQASPVI
jgi:nitronate monooxygenase